MKETLKNPKKNIQLRLLTTTVSLMRYPLYEINYSENRLKKNIHNNTIRLDQTYGT